MSKDLAYVFWFAIIAWNAYNLTRVGVLLYKDYRNPLTSTAWRLGGWGLGSVSLALIVLGIVMIGRLA